MLWAMIRFYMGLLENYFTSNHHHEELVLDTNHPHYRRYSKQYKRKKGVVKDIWIINGMITLLFPLLEVAVVLMLLSTFISFCILDETK